MARRTYFLIRDLENQRMIARALVQFGLDTRQEIWSLLTKDDVLFSLNGVVADYARAYCAAMQNEKVDLDVAISTQILKIKFLGFRQICVSSETGEVDVEQTVAWINNPNHGWLDKLTVDETVYYLADAGQVLRFLGGQTPMAKLRDFLIANYNLQKIQKVCTDLEIDPGRQIFGRGTSVGMLVETVLQYVESEPQLRKQFVKKVKIVWRESALNVPDWR